jgi:hypothetical protein
MMAELWRLQLSDNPDGTAELQLDPVSPSAVLIEDGFDAAVKRADHFVRHQRRNGLIPQIVDIVRAAIGGMDD